MDYYFWLKQQADLIENGQLPDVAVADEIRAQAKREKRALESFTRLVIEYLIKLEYIDHESLLFKENQRGWKKSVNNHKKSIKRLIKDSPSLQQELEQLDFKEIVEDILYQFSLSPEYAMIENVRQFNQEDINEGQTPWNF